ncbi:MAG: universal stress protein [Mycobacterium sp.]
MVDLLPAPAVVVGIDGSRTAVNAAVWAIDEAVGRDIPLRLVYAIDPVHLAATDGDHSQFACARAALHEARRTVEATGAPVKVETEIVCGKPLATLAGESRSAAMVCVGAIGTEHACRGSSSVVAALPGLAHCPVAVIRPPARRAANTGVGSIIAEADNDVVLHHAFAQARLRGAPLRAVVSWRPEVPDDIADGSRWAQAYLNRRLDRWTRLYPDVAVESVAAYGSLCEYLAKNAAPVDVLVAGPKCGRCASGSPGRVECSVLTVPGDHL